MVEANTKGKFSKLNIRPETAGLIEKKLLDVNQGRLKRGFRKISIADFVQAAIRNTDINPIIELQIK